MIFTLLTVLLVLLAAGLFSKTTSSGFSMGFGFQSLVSVVKPRNLVSSLLYLMNVFDFLWQTSFGVQFVWTAGFGFWVLGCSFWVLQLYSASLSLVLVSVGFCLLAILLTSDVRLSRPVSLEKTSFRFSVGILIASISVVAMLLFKSFAAGITVFASMSILSYSWKIVFDGTREEF